MGIVPPVADWDALNVMPNKPNSKAAPLTLQHFEKFARAIQADFRNIDGKVDHAIDKVQDEMNTGLRSVKT
ncbi:MAG: hypothetical protein ABSD38_33015 [Syntrophorhabdales bacterium]|jgi:hypothetical protein